MVHLSLISPWFIYQMDICQYTKMLTNIICRDNSSWADLLQERKSFLIPSTNEGKQQDKKKQWRNYKSCNVSRQKNLWHTPFLWPPSFCQPPIISHTSTYNNNVKRWVTTKEILILKLLVQITWNNAVIPKMCICKLCKRGKDFFHIIRCYEYVVKLSRILL